MENYLDLGGCYPPRPSSSVDKPLPRFLDMLQYFEAILPLVDSPYSSQQDEVYFMGGGAAWILVGIRNLLKAAGIGNVLVLTC